MIQLALRLELVALSLFGAFLIPDQVNYKLITSTMHVEDIALSTGIREMVPVKNTLSYVCKNLNVDIPPSAKVIKVWKDNEGDLKLATSPKEKSNSLHKALEYRWF